MSEASEHAVSNPLLRQKARIAAFPLWLHVRAYSTLSLMIAGAIGAAVTVLVGWKPFSYAVEFFSVWCFTGFVLYWASFGWYSLRRELIR